MLLPSVSLSDTNSLVALLSGGILPLVVYLICSRLEFCCVCILSSAAEHVMVY